jgi:Holliday junction resolvase RusA-like endonuclease
MTSGVVFRAKIDVIKHGVKKNSRSIMYNSRTKKPFLGKSKDLINLQNHLINGLVIWKETDRNNIERYPITFKVHAKMTFFFDNYFTKKGMPNKKIPDLSNLYQLVEDCLESAGVIEDDRLIESHDGSRRMSGPKNHVEIELIRYIV